MAIAADDSVKVLNDADDDDVDWRTFQAETSLDNEDLGMWLSSFMQTYLIGKARIMLPMRWGQFGWGRGDGFIKATQRVAIKWAIVLSVGL